MEIVLAALVAAAVAVAVVLLIHRPGAVQAAAGTVATPERAAGGDSRPAGATREGIEEELVARRTEIARLEERLRAKDQSLGIQAGELDERERSLADRQRNLDHTREELKEAKRDQIRELERVAGLSAAQAKQIMMRELEDELRHDSARLVRQVEEETRRDADRRVRSILSTVMQRVASGHAVETTVSVVELKSDELKGRIIGREGRNIRSLETLTGIDFIIDDTPGAVLLSGFDGVRREIARLTLERLLQDGRIHPARIEEAYHQAKSEIDQHIARAALMHDIGKAVSHETEGPHALVGGELARRYKETEGVAHAMESHHNEVEPQTVEAVIVQIVDALSGARPGARGESLEQYVKRLHELEAIATRHAGVEKVYAMHAGREIRVIVHPEEIDDDEAALLSHRIARDVEKELEYPGQIKVTVIRESRATDYAK